jgi:hypothetical protein
VYVGVLAVPADVNTKPFVPGVSLFHVVDELA